MQQGKVTNLPAGGQPLVERQALVLVHDILFGNEGGDMQMQGRVLRFLCDHGAPELLHGLLDHPGVEVESHRCDMAGLLFPQEVARPTNFKVHRGDPEPGAELGKFLDRNEPLLRIGREAAFIRGETVGVSLLAAAPHPPAKLVELGKAEGVRPTDQDRVGVGHVQA